MRQNYLLMLSLRMVLMYLFLEDAGHSMTGKFTSLGNGLMERERRGFI